LEAIFYLATMASFRVSTAAAMIRSDPEVSQAVVRGEVVAGERELLLEAALRQSGRSHFQVNRQRMRRRELLGLIPVSVFMPDDLVLVKGGPSERRHYLDEALAQIDPRMDVVRTDVENVLRQRNALLRQSGSRLGSEAAMTLEVWDRKLAEAGEQLAGARRSLAMRLEPRAATAYGEIAGQALPLEMVYESTWQAGELSEALLQAQSEDLRRGVSTVGPHRDDLSVVLGGRSVRTHASQGEQRSLALALRLAVHRELAEASGQSPLLLLDDVFSELDPVRSQGVLRALQSEQTLLTSAGAASSDIAYDARFRVADGRIYREM
jgi:DNA replication and repair protein RecF